MSTTSMPPLVGVEPMDRFEWERILKRIRMPKPLKFLALVLATYADEDGSRVRPGQDLLAADTGATDRTVRRQLDDLRDRYGLIEQLTRGGGRGRGRRTSVYRLTIPVDLFDRCDVRSPDDRPIRSGRIEQVRADGSGRGSGGRAYAYRLTIPESPDIQVSGETEDAPVDNLEPPDIQVSGQCGPSPVDNLVAPEIPQQIDRTSDVASDGLTGHFEAIDRTQLCPTTNHYQPPKRPTSALEPAQPPDARDLDDELPNLIPSQSNRKCGHGLSPAIDDDGAPRCPLCRRAIRHLASVPALSA